MKLRNILCVLLAAMLLVMTGCGAKDVSGSVTPLPTTEATGAEGTAEAGTKATTEATVDATADTIPTQPTETGNPFSLGRMEGGIYANAYLGIGCKLDSKWTFAGATELQEMPAEVQNSLSGSAADSLFEKYTQLFDMKAENAEQLTTINVVLTKLSPADKITYGLLDSEGVIDSILDTQHDLLVDSYKAAGIQVQKLEKKTVTYLGQQRAALYMAATIEGMPYYTLQLFEYALGDYGATVTFASYTEDKTQSLLELFYSL